MVSGVVMSLREPGLQALVFVCSVQTVEHFVTAPSHRDTLQAGNVSLKNEQLFCFERRTLFLFLK